MPANVNRVAGFWYRELSFPSIILESGKSAQFSGSIEAVLTLIGLSKVLQAVVGFVSVNMVDDGARVHVTMRQAPDNSVDYPCLPIQLETIIAISASASDMTAVIAPPGES